MEILEHGPADGSPRRSSTRWHGGALIAAVLVGAVVVGNVADGERRPVRAEPRSAVPSLSLSFGPAAAGVDVLSSFSVQRGETAGDFVVQVAIINRNPQPVRVQAGAAPDRRGLIRLAVAVMPATPSPKPPTFAVVASAARSPLLLDGNRTAELTFAGRVGCRTAAVNLDTWDIMVDDVAKTVELPDIGDVTESVERSARPCPE